MSVIRILQEEVASQIAAGEVIERPASVVRELLDNSIDAGSDRIVIKVEKGGKRSIRVSDNGVGMSRDDLLLCLERHATSKIRSVADLFSIRTLGFRGEALPSISAVSRMEITSRTTDQLVGHRVRVAGGRLKSIDETGAPSGTIVDVRDLFFNMPAREKFLRGVKTESDHIIDTLSRIALPLIHIHFRLDDVEKTVLNLPVSENEVNRLSVLMGRNVAEAMIDTYQEVNDLRIRAYLAPPGLTRSRADRIFTYVNNRNIRDRLITRATIEGYGQRLMKGRYPQAALFIEIDPNLVDINVHPAKQEIRFHHGHWVYQAIVSTLERGFTQRVHAIFDIAHPKAKHRRKDQITDVFMAESAHDYGEHGEKRTVHPEFALQEDYLLKEIPQIIGQLKDTYILCQAGDGLLMVDQHAAHERIVYENLKKSYQDSKIERQTFLIPQKLEFSMKEGRVILKRIEKLVQLGLELDHFGGSTFLLRAVPSILINVHWENFLTDLLSILEEEGDFTNEVALDRFLTLMACHGAIRAGQRMSKEEMALLLNQLQDLDLATHCPHGRPIFKKFTYYEIEKMFKRVV